MTFAKNFLVAPGVLCSRLLSVLRFSRPFKCSFSINRLSLSINAITSKSHNNNRYAKSNLNRADRCASNEAPGRSCGNFLCKNHVQLYNGTAHWDPHYLQEKRALGGPLPCSLSYKSKAFGEKISSVVSFINCSQTESAAAAAGATDTHFLLL